MVRVFTTPTCSHCFSLKQFFKEHNIEFEEVDVSKDEKARGDMIEKTGQMEVPVVEINGEMIVGFDKKKIFKTLNLKD